MTRLSPGWSSPSAGSSSRPLPRGVLRLAVPAGDLDAAESGVNALLPRQTPAGPSSRPTACSAPPCCRGSPSSSATRTASAPSSGGSSGSRSGSTACAARLPRRVARASVRERVRGRPRVARARHDGDHLPRLSAALTPGSRTSSPRATPIGLGTGRPAPQPGSSRGRSPSRTRSTRGWSGWRSRRSSSAGSSACTCGRRSHRWSRSPPRDSRTCSRST